MRAAATLLVAPIVVLVSATSALSQPHQFPGYWPTAVPTTTPAAGAGAAVPSGRSLVKAMYAVMRRYGSVHVVINGQFVEPGVESGTLQATEDVSARTDVSHYLGRTEVKALSTQAVDYTSVEENVAVKHTQATRGEPGEIPEAWTCEPVPGKLSASYFTVYQWKHLTEVKNHGLALVDGQLTWHVTAFAIWKSGKKHLTHYEPVDYYIAQSNDALVRELDDAAMNGPDKLIPYTQILDYSAYGQPVSIKLPKRCRSHAR